MPLTNVHHSDQPPAKTPWRTLAECESLRGRFPFRLGTSSYIIPADILPNVHALAPVVDDIELVVFESADISNIPTPEVAAELGRLRSIHDLSYTLHLPLDIELGHSDESYRRRSVARCLQIIERLKSASPFANVLHFSHPSFPQPLPTADIPRWQTALSRSTDELLAAGVPPQSLCIETLSYPFELVEEIVVSRNLAVCLDIGHLMLKNYDVAAHFDRCWSRTRIVHLHGIREGRDHRDIADLESDLLALVVRHLCDNSRERVLTLELFSEEDLALSLCKLKEFLP